MTAIWPHMTASHSAVRGEYKQRPEDFRVEEVPAYETSNEGEHVFFEIEKRGLSTHEALERMARALGVAPRAFGIAGLKDAQGVTRQHISVQGFEPAAIEALALRDMRVLWARKHRNKLRIGHLRGNRFVIRLRNVDVQALDAARASLDELVRRGVPNYFGEQRFGMRGDTWRVGRALLLGDLGEAVAWIAGRPGPHDTGRVRRARELFEAGEFEHAAEAWPGGFRTCIRLCRSMAKSAGNPKRALYVLDRSLQRFYTSAYQSWLFNQVVAARIDELDRVLEGDLAWLHRNGAVFLVKDLAVDAPRASALEISASGPLFGRRMSRPIGRALELELAVLAGAGHSEEAFARPGPLQWQGARRPLRFPLAEAGVTAGDDEHGAFFELRFVLPPGCYATAVLREMLKHGDVDEALVGDTSAALETDAALEVEAELEE